MADRTEGPEAGSDQGTGDGAAVMRGRIKEQSKTALNLAEKRGRLKQLARRRDRSGPANQASAGASAATEDSRRS